MAGGGWDLVGDAVIEVIHKVREFDPKDPRWQTDVVEPAIRRHTRPMVSIYKLRLVTMQVDALSAKQVSKGAPRLTCQ